MPIYFANIHLLIMSSPGISEEKLQSRNELYPIFLKLHQLEVLIVGAGNVGLEKLEFMLKSSPRASITVIATKVSEEVLLLLRNYPQVKVIERAFEPEDVNGKDIVIGATNIREVNAMIRVIAKGRGCLVNVADTPDLCDFYLGSIVTRGDLKVAISTNGKSPTFAKRFRQLLEASLPEETGELLTHLKSVRDQLEGNFAYKVNYLNRLTRSLLDRPDKIGRKAVFFPF